MVWPGQGGKRGRNQRSMFLDSEMAEMALWLWYPHALAKIHPLPPHLSAMLDRQSWNSRIPEVTEYVSGICHHHSRVKR